MAVGVGNRIGRGGSEGRTARAALRTAGRAALWVLVGLLLVRGFASVLADPRQSDPAAASPSEAVDPSTGSFAVRFVRAYLDGASPNELGPLLAPGASVPSVGTDLAQPFVEHLGKLVGACHPFGEDGQDFDAKFVRQRFDESLIDGFAPSIALALWHFSRSLCTRL